MKEQSLQPNQPDLQSTSAEKASVGKFNPAQIKKTLTFIKKPKVLTLVILITTVLLITLVLNLTSQKEDENPPLPSVNVTQATPSPSQDASLENISQRVKTYTDKLNGTKNYHQEIVYPIVDLDINF